MKQRADFSLLLDRFRYIINWFGFGSIFLEYLINSMEKEKGKRRKSCRARKLATRNIRFRRGGESVLQHLAQVSKRGKELRNWKANEIDDDSDL